ncbi:MAG: hypothetical protein AAFX01_00080 [Cyanobacteria bacterium J06638_28]
MHRFALALTALMATVAIAPGAYAVPAVEELRQVDFAQEAVTADELQGEIFSSDALATDTSEAVGLDERRATLDSATAAINRPYSEGADETPILDIFVFDI